MLKLEIVTPERKVFDETVDSVTVPTATGEAGILTNHAPLISALKPGILSFVTNGVVEKLAVAGGFVEVSENRVSVMTDTAESAADVNVQEAKAQREEAEKALTALSTASLEETEAERERLEGANVRLQLAASK